MPDEAVRPEPLTIHCAACGHEWAPCFTPVALDLVAKVLTKPSCPQCGGRKHLMGPKPKPTRAGDVVGWLWNGDTGVSSETIWSVLSGRVVPRQRWRADIPHDAADFGRCYRLLQIMPEWRGRLSEVAAQYPAWRPFVDAWDELSALYEAEYSLDRAPRLNARVRELAAQAAVAGGSGRART